MNRYKVTVTYEFSVLAETRMDASQKIRAKLPGPADLATEGERIDTFMVEVDPVTGEERGPLPDSRRT